MTTILGTSLSGLMASQRSLETVSHNIANASTEGYSRQTVDLRSRPPFFSNAGFIGQGVDAKTVTRSYDQFITAHLNTTTSLYAESNTLATLASQVDTVVSSEKTGIAPTFSQFFGAVNEMANDPTSIPARQVLLSQADAVAQQLNTTAAQLQEFRNQNNNQMEAMVKELNGYAQSVAELNIKIGLESSYTSAEHQPNDLLDQRDRLVAKIAEKVNVNVINQTDGSQTIVIGNGQSLVLGGKAAKMAVVGSATDLTFKDITVNSQVVTSQISGGQLAGALRFRDEILDPAQQQFGLLAAGFAVSFDTLHKAGFDLNGDPGQELFGFGDPALEVPISPHPDNSGTATATYDPATIGQLTASDYSLTYNGSNYSLTRLSDKSVTTFPGAVPATISGPGFTVVTDGGVAAGDSFLIRPTFYAASRIKAVITDPKLVAAAGTGSSGAPIVADNTIAVQMADLEKKAVLLDGKATFNDVYSQLVGKVGTATHAINTQSESHKVLLSQANQSQQALAGVNLDEEAANLIKFQNSYQASSKAISIASSLFDSLISAIR